MMQTLNSIASIDVEGVEGLEDRIIAATTTGEMLSCNTFDKLLERYFDGVILAPTFQNFQSHFDQCSKCRRLLAGIEDAVAMCREAKEVELAVPDSLHERIVAATTGPKKNGWLARIQNSFITFAGLVWTPQMAAAALIFAASSLMIISRWGSVGGMAEHAETKAKRIVNESQQRISDTGAKARSGFQSVSFEVNSLLFQGETKRPGAHTTRPRASHPSPTPEQGDSDREPQSPKRKQ
jgi:hypothetical protein